MIKPVSIFLRLLSILAVMGVRIVAAVVEGAAEFLGVIAYEVAVPTVRRLEEAQDGLARASSALRADEEEPLEIRGTQ